MIAYLNPLRPLMAPYSIYFAEDEGILESGKQLSSPGLAGRCILRFRLLPSPAFRPYNALEGLKKPSRAL